MLQNVIPRTHPGNVGDVIKWSNGHKYEKTKNGKWKLILSQPLKRKILKLYKTSTLRQVADEVGISMSTVQGVVNEEGASKGKADLIHSTKEKLLVNKRKIFSLYKKGKSLQEIADLLEIRDYAHIRKVVEAELELRDPKERAALFIKKAIDKGTAGCVKAHNASLSRASKLRFTSYEDYYYHARTITNSVIHAWSRVIDPKSKRSPDYHVDHQLSIFDGWHEYSESKNKYVKRTKPVPLKLLVHPANLKLMPGKTNMTKHSRSHLTLDQLQSKINSFEKQYGNPFPF